MRKLILVLMAALIAACSAAPSPSPTIAARERVAFVPMTPEPFPTPYPPIEAYPLDGLSRMPPRSTPTPAPTPPPTPKPTPKPKPVYASVWPIAAKHVRVSQGFGCTGHGLSSYGRCRRFHGGYDLVAPAGSKVLAARSGTVVLAGWVDNCGGRQVLIRSKGNVYLLYAHLSATLTRAGRTVKAGQAIGRVGASGCASGTHLHFGASIGWPWRGGFRFVNPRAYKLVVRVS